jgi:phosphatidylinositol glycan class S
LEDLEKQLVKLRGLSQNENYAIYVLPDGSRLLAQKPVIIGRTRMAFVSFTQDINQLFDHISHIVREIFVNDNAVYKAYQSAVAHSDMKADKDSMRALQSSPGYDVTFTLQNPQPEVLRATWDVGAAVDKYMRHLLNSFSDYAHITVKSQYLYSTGLGVQVQKTERGSKLSSEQLPHIINPVEAYLGSHISTNPSINFVVYIPTREQSPLNIYDSDGEESSTNAFLSPRWGGLLIYNIDSSVTNNQSLPVNVSVDMQHIMSIFMAQLRLLLGIHQTVAAGQVLVMDPGNKIVSDWELDEWLRERCVENIFTSSSTLVSLAELLGKISNIVINDDIGAQVVKSVEAIQRSSRLLASGQLKEAFTVSRQARDASEKAFFDPSLLELLYFPEDQKFAIYVPLFLPVGFPIILSLYHATKWLTGRGSSKKEEKQKTE